MTDVIPPAISAESWAHYFKVREDLGHGKTFAVYDLADVVGRSPEECFEHMALNNAELPDGDQRKFTKADVDALQDTLAYVRRHSDWDIGPLVDVAARIAALLPPQP